MQAPPQEVEPRRGGGGPASLGSLASSGQSSAECCPFPGPGLQAVEPSSQGG